MTDLNRIRQQISLTALAGLAVRPEELRLNMVPETVQARRALAQKTRSLTALAMLPPPMKPIPVSTWAAMRPGSPRPPEMWWESTVKRVAPMQMRTAFAIALSVCLLLAAFAPASTAAFTLPTSVTSAPRLR